MITKEYWNNRVKKYGHTGWSDSITYAYDQKARLFAVEKVIAALNPNRSTAFDFGTGSGDFAKLLSDHFKQVIAFDISDSVVEIAKRKYGNTTKITFLVGKEIKESGIMPKTVDLVLSVTVLQHIMDDTELTGALNYFHDIMKDNAFIIAFEHCLGHRPEIIQSSYQRFMGLEDWRQTFLNSGLSLSKTYGFYHPIEMPCETYLWYRSHFTYAKVIMLRLLPKYWANKYYNHVARKSIKGKDDFLWDEKRESVSKIMVFKKSC
jgi:SAM-dependent methyltransferase